MKKDIRFMLLGIYLLVASLWCITIGLSIVGAVVLPLISLGCMVRGFCGMPRSQQIEMPEQEDSAS